MEEDTILFLPDRLNREPIVFKGLTMTEIFVSMGLGFGIGLIIGCLFAYLTGKWVCIPSGGFLFIFVMIGVAGKVFTRLKRGKPDTWLTRYIDLKLFKLGINRSSRLILDDDIWVIHRSKK